MLQPKTTSRATIEGRRCLSEAPHFRRLRHGILDPKPDLEKTKTLHQMKNRTALANNENHHAKTLPISGDFWVKEPRQSENISDEK